MKRTNLSPAWLLLSAGALTPTAATAQEGQPYVMDPVTVTATKRPQDPQKIDAMIGVAGPDDVFTRNFLSVDRLDRIFPDVNIRSRSSRVYSNITIRGQTSIDFYNPTVQLLVDGLPQDQTTFSQLLPASLERIELLYGPQGTLYGRSAVGGVLSIVTQKPDGQLRAVGSGAFGSLDRDARFWASGPIVPNLLYGDAAMTYREERGQYRDIATGDRFGDTFDRNMRFRVRLAPQGSPLDITVVGAHSALRSEEEQFVSIGDIEKRTAFPLPAHYRLKVNSFGLTGSYDFGGAVATVLTGYQDRKLERTVFGQDSPEDQRTFSQEIRLASVPAADRPVDYVIGAFFQNLDFERRVPSANQISRHDIDSYAVFGEATWHATRKLDLTAGLRFDYEQAEAEGAGAVTLSGSKSFTALSPKAAIGYQIYENVRIYASYGTGYKPGGFTRNISAQNIAFTFDPQVSHNGEVGLKTRLFGGRLSLSAAGYFTYTRDYQLFVGFQPNQYLQNVGEVVAKGFNLRFTAYPLDALRVTGGLGLNDTRFETYRNPANPGQDLTGKYVPYAPSITANLNIEYRIDLPRGLGRLVPRWGMSYIGETHFDEANTIGQKRYALFDAGVTWAVGDHFKIDAYVDNITNKTFATYGFDAGPFLGKFVQLGRGREYGARLTLKY